VSMKTDAKGTALITGASSGIGEEFARRLAARRHRLVLVARREDRLRALAEELLREHGVSVEVLRVDLSQGSDIERLRLRAAELDDLEILVNNAGFGTRGRFVGMDPQKQHDMITLHIIASAVLARSVLPRMIARGRGAIINVSSVAAFFPLRGNATYSATKAYLNAFTEALHTELIGTGVRVQALCPGFTLTEFHATPEYAGVNVRARVPGFMWMTAGQVVGESLRALERGKVICIPGRRYRLLTRIGRLGPVAEIRKLVAARLRR